MSATLSELLPVIRRHSQYAADMLDRCPDLLTEADLGALVADDLRCQASAVADIGDEADFRDALRYLRHRHMVRIIARDFGGLAGVEETLADTSDVAEALIQAACVWATRRAVEQWGTPMGQRSGLPQHLMVLGMGKLGGRELNFSSDIDLIFAFAEHGETVGNPRSLSNEEFFLKVGRMMNAALAATTAWGFVYRVDMRLRPFGESGQLAQSLESLDNYYRTHGRPWERHAMVKMRALTGQEEDIARLHAMVFPFVYRTYADFSMLDSLRDLKRMIAEDLTRQGRPDDLKLGVGGIREIEFIVQSYQLIHGGRDSALRGRSLLPMLAALAERRYLDPQDAARLKQSYLFLRRLENHVQMGFDQQTHCLPDDPGLRALLATGMGFADEAALLAALGEVRAEVSRQFDAVFQEEPVAAALPRDHGPQWQQHLHAFHTSKRVLTLSEIDRQRLDAVMPLLLAEISDVETLRRILQVLEAVLRRSVYLLLLKSSGQARQTLIRLCAASPWLTDILAASPALLDQMLNRAQLFALSGRQALIDEMNVQLGADPDDERLMTVIRHVKQAAVFKVAANDLINELPLMKVSDYLTWTAEAVVDVALDYIWRMARKRHGQPGGWDDESVPMLVVGFGKLGGLELNYASDLDMVFLSHDQLPPEDMSAGPHALEGAIYMTRLGQRLINVLSTTLISGVAYQVDSRLRPHGASGMLINSLGAFFRYERKQAWVWEHQALIRTRAIAGHPALKQQFEALRLEFLCQPRDEATLRNAVLEMRQKMYTHLDKSRDDAFDLKQGKGGIIDLEFLVQYLILRHAHQHPQVAHYSDNIRQLDSLAGAGVISQAENHQLRQAWLALRQLAHQAALAKSDGFCPPDQVQQWRGAIGAAWGRYLG